MRKLSEIKFTIYNWIAKLGYKIFTWSNALVKKQANVEAKVMVRSRQAAPMATPTRFCSAM